MPLLKHSRTLSIIRFLRAAGPLPRRHRIPAQRQPDLIRKGYFDAIMPLLRRQLAAWYQVRPEVVRLLKDERAADGRADSPRKDRAQQLVDRAAERVADAYRPTEVAEVARKFGKRTSDFQREQLDRQVRAAFSVPLSTIEAPIRDKLETFSAVNVDLIKTVPERMFDRIRLDVEDAFESGMHPSTLADLFVERDDMSENDANRIARDQIGKLNAQFNEERQEAMGVTQYVWRGALDNRERDEHRDLEGQTFSWDEPPDAGTDGEPANPGEAIQCRCYAEPDFSQILADIEG